MSSQDTTPNALQRAHVWLLEKEGLRVKLLGSLVGSGVAILLLATLFLVAMHHAFNGTGNSMSGAREGWEFLNLAGYLIAGVAAIGALVASTWYTLRIYQRHIHSVELAEIRARFIIETCPDAIVMVDSQGIILSCNPATETIFGYDRSQTLGQKITLLIPQRHFLLDLTAMGRENFMAYAQRKNTVRFPVEITVSQADYEGHRHFIVLIHDASNRRYSDETVHHISLSVSSTTGAEYVCGLVQQLSMALHVDFAFIAETDNQANGAFCSLTMAEHGQPRRMTKHALPGTAFEEALQNGLTVVSEGAPEKFPNDPLLRDLEAESIIVMPLTDHLEQTVGLIGVISCAPAHNVGIARQTLQIFAARAAAEIERKQEVEGLASEKNRLAGHVNVIRDTAARERKRYEEDIAAEQELLAVTLRSIREGCITTDNDGRIITLNSVAEHLTGWTQPEAAERPLNEILRLTSIRGARPLDASRLLENAGQMDSQAMVVSQDGTRKMVEVSVAPICARKNFKLGTVLVMRDVTEKQSVEDERLKAERLESIGLAAGGIAHDFNNLLTAVIGNLSLALLEANPSVRERIEVAKTAAFRAQDLTRQLLTFARGGAPVKKTASLRQIVLETLDFSLSGTNLRSSLHLPEDLWPVDIDVGQISQVIGNLSVNAVQAMENGGTLHVTGENLQISEKNAPPTLRPGRYVRISVRDEGPGIPEEIQKKIFDPYFTTKATGSGLGLATSYSIVKNHDGFIAVESAPGKGATFHLYLPASDKKIEPETPPPAPEPERRPPQGKPGGKILVLDDEEIIGELVASTLTPLGYTVVQTTDSLSMLRLYKEALQAGHRFDLVMMDLTLPGGMGGRDAIKELKKLDPKTKAIVSSGYAMDAVMTDCTQYGFCGAIAKPFDLCHLAEVVRKALSD